MKFVKKLKSFFNTPIHIRLKSAIRDSTWFSLLMNIDIDWIFVVLAMLLIPNLEIWERVLIAIGLTYVYKMFIKDILIIESVKSRGGK